MPKTLPRYISASSKKGVTIEWENQAEFKAALKKAGKGVKDIVKDLINEAGLELLNEVKRRCKVDKGRLRSSFRLKFTDDGNVANVFTERLEAVFLELGTKAHEIWPRVKQALRFKVKVALKSGKTKKSEVIVKHVHHPGFPASPFMVPAFELTRSKLEKRLRVVLGRFWR